MRLKRLARAFGVTLVLCVAASPGWSQPRSETAFTIPEADLIPEGIAYDAAARTFYVGSTYKRKISRIDSSGAVRDFTGARDGLWGVVGMHVDPARRHLWAASSHAGPGMPMQEMNPEEEGSSGVFKYDLESETLIKRYVLTPDPDGHFLNDLTVNSRGDVFITDSRTRAIYTISPERDSLEVFLKLEKSPNGITLSEDERYLFVALDGDVGRVRMSDRSFSWLAKPAGVNIHADGLYFYRDALISIEPFDTSGVVDRYVLSDDYSAIERHESVESDHPLFVQPTTGVLVGDEFFYLANSQLQVFRRMYEEKGDRYESSFLKDVVVLKVWLD